MHMRPFATVALSCLFFAAAGTPAFGQAGIYSWNSTGSDWSSAANWTLVSGTGTGTPSATRSAEFRTSTPLPGSTVFDPVINNASNALSLTIATNQNLGGWNFTGTGSLTVGGTGTTGLTTYGPGTFTFNGPALIGTATDSPNITVGSSGTLVLAGNTTAATNFGTTTVRSGKLVLDNTASVASRLGSAGATNLVTLTGGSTLELIGNATSSVTQNVGNLNAGSNTIGGVNFIQVTPNGQLTELIFANSASGFSTRPGTRGVYHYVTSSGNLGDANGGRISFVGSPFLGANGLLGNTDGGGTFGFALATDAGGTDFATWNATQGVVRAAPTDTANNESEFNALPNADNTTRVQLNIAAATTVTAVGNRTIGSLRISPGGAGAELAMGTNNLVTNAIMLDGPHNFTISGTGNVGGTGTRYFHVNNPDAVLSTSIVVANGGNPTVFAGPGFVELTGSGSQNTLTASNRFVIAGGTVRGNNTQIGFGPTGGNGIISLSGGVLEITGGANGTGTSADFRRSLGSSAGNVTWGALSTNEQGSGGFSAFGNDASVNLGGSADQLSIRWNQGNFVADGHALIFGSTRSNAVLNFLNPIFFDNPDTTGNPYHLREIRVIAGTGGDKTVLHGEMRGTSSADFIKTGDGILELLGNNIYEGNTFIAGGTLIASNLSGSATGSGNVTIGSGATLAGEGFLGAPSGSVTALAGGRVAPGTDGTVGTLTFDSRLDLLSGSIFSWDINNATPAAADIDTGGSNAVDAQDQITIFGSSNTLSTGDITFRVQELVAPTNLTEGETYSWLVATTSGAPNIGAVTFDLSDAPTYASFATANDYFFSLSVVGADVYLNFQPVPEPATILMVSGLVLGAGAWMRRRSSRGLANVV